MVQFTHAIQNELGIHARPAGMLAKKAAIFKSSIMISNHKRKADAKKIISIMMMAVEKGDMLTFTIEGEDEQEAASELESFLKDNL